MVKWHTEGIGSNWSAPHRKEEKDRQRAAMIVESLDVLGLTPDMYLGYRRTEHFAAIAGLALEDPDNPMTYFQAEILFYARRAEQVMVTPEPTGQFNIEFEGISFGGLSGLQQLMWDEAD